MHIVTYAHCHTYFVALFKQYLPSLPHPARWYFHLTLPPVTHVPAGVEPGNVNYTEWLILAESDMKGVKKKGVRTANNPYLLPPKSSWDGLFLS